MNKIYNAFQGLFSALSFLTVIPVPERFTDGEEGLKRSVNWFPAAGLIIGLLAAIADSLIFSAFPSLLRASFCMFYFILISKALHLDGLADTADGFLSSRPKDRILEIMRDSRTGTMGAAAVAGIMILKTASVFSLGKGIRPEALILAPISGRCAMVIIMSFFKYARKDGGLASIFYEGIKRRNGLISAAFLCLMGLIVSGIQGFLVMLAVLAFVFLWGLYSRKVIGGFTGDTLGAGCELSEALTLICFACVN